MASSRTISYDESVKVFAQSGDLIGDAHFRGRAYQSRASELWTWSGRLTHTAFDPGVITKAGELRLDFDDGATGQALYTNVQVAGSGQGGLYGWVEVQGNGMPPRV